MKRGSSSQKDLSEDFLFPISVLKDGLGIAAQMLIEEPVANEEDIYGLNETSVEQ